VIEGLVSTIIPVFNRPAMLREAVGSVLAQTWRPIEIIVVDDGSTDDTLRVARELRGDHSDIVHVLTQANAGPGVARQAGVEVARGEFVQFLDSDDLLLPHKFEVQVAGLRADPAAGISYGKTYTREAGVRLAQAAQQSGVRMRTLFPAMLQEPIWPTLSPLYRRSALERIGRWPPRRQLEDWEFDAQAAALGIQLHYCGEVFIAETRNHGRERLSSLWRTQPAAMRERVTAYLAVLGHAQKAGLSRETPEMQRFARSLFWTARQAANQGLSGDAGRLLRAARSVALGPQWDMRLFGWAGGLLGYRLAIRLTNHLEGSLRSAPTAQPGESR
jgi:glycosyltransferase involved in cell wall biosynthesis